MMLVYTVESIGQNGKRRKQTYQGFRRAWDQPSNPATVVATVFIDGEAEWWEIEMENVSLTVDELKRYYRAEHEREVEVYIYDLRK